MLVEEEEGRRRAADLATAGSNQRLLYEWSDHRGRAVPGSEEEKDEKFVNEADKPGTKPPSLADYTQQMQL